MTWAYYTYCPLFVTDDVSCITRYDCFVICAETKSEVTLSAHLIFSEFFTAQMLTELCRQLVLNYFPLREDELKCWLTDPENFSEFD